MNFTKLIGVLIFAVSFNAYSQNTNTTDNSIGGWKTLKEKNYSINYPDSWMLNTSGQMGGILFCLVHLPLSKINLKTI